MRIAAFAAALAGGAALASAASAGATTFDEIGDFSTVAFSQGLGQCQLDPPSCIAVDGARTGLEKAFDTTGGGAPVVTTFHSLGAYGFATFGVGPNSAIRGATTLEATFGNNGGAGWPEALTIVLHNDFDATAVAGWQDDLTMALGLPNLDGPLGGQAVSAFGRGPDGTPIDDAGDVTGSELFALLNTNVLGGTAEFVGYVTNDGNSQSSDDIITAAGVSITRTDAGQNGWRFEIVIPESFGQFGYITFLDQTMSDTPSFWQDQRGDGWDLAHLSVTADVPEPATTALFGLGLLAAGRLRRRR